MNGIAIVKHTVSLETAQKLIDQALGYASEIGKNVSVAVVDESGYLMAFGRMNSSNASSVQIAIDKAYTAATTRTATHRWQEIMEEDEPLKIGAPAGVPRLIVFGGGQPIMSEGECVGAIGVSGGHWTGDTEIGSVALRSIESGG